MSHVTECCNVFSTDVTPTCAALQSLTESAQYLRCNRNDQCDAVHCNVTYSLFQSHVSMINFTIMPCNLPPSVWVSGSNESGGIVLDLVTNHSQNIPVIDKVSLTISVVQLTNAIGFEVSVYADWVQVCTCECISEPWCHYKWKSEVSTPWQCLSSWLWNGI